MALDESFEIPPETQLVNYINDTLQTKATFVQNVIRQTSPNFDIETTPSVFVIYMITGYLDNNAANADGGTSIINQHYITSEFPRVAVISMGKDQDEALMAFYEVKRLIGGKEPEIKGVQVIMGLHPVLQGIPFQFDNKECYATFWELEWQYKQDRGV